MAQNYYTLDEAAEKLGISVSDFKRRLRTEWTHIRPLQDGSTQRFKAKDVEELARQIGFGSEEELQLVDPSGDEMNLPLELDLAADDAPKPAKSTSGKAKSTSSKKSVPKTTPPIDDNPLILGDQDVFLLADDTGSKKISPSQKAKMPPKVDSDVRLQKSGKIFPSARDDEGTEEVELDILPKTGSSTKMTTSGKKSSTSSGKLNSTSSTKLGSKTGKLPSVPESDSSEFELTLDSDSDEFELSLATDSSDEISLDLPPISESGKAGASGINLGKPADTGVSLEGGSGILRLAGNSAIQKKKPGDSTKMKLGDSSKTKLGDSTKTKAGDSSIGRKSGKIPKPDTGSDEEIDFELSLDQAGASSKKLGSAKNLDSDSEFDLTLDEELDDHSNPDGETAAFEVSEEPKNDIFETDFEIPALDDDSASEAVAIDEADTDLESSDFDLAIDESADVSVGDESASQVVVLDDETEEEPVKPKKKTTTAKTKKRPAVDDDGDVVAEDAVSFDDMELDESMSASKALKGVTGEEEGDEEEQDERAVVVGAAPWGPLPALFLLPTVFIVFMGGIMAFEMMHSMWGYHQPTKPASLVIDNVAQMLDMKPKE